MKTTEEKIAIMQAFVEGKIIESSKRGNDNWTRFPCEPNWNWDDLDYRIKQEPEYIPFDFTDAEQLIGKIVRYKSTHSLSVITNVNPKNVTSSGTVIKYEDLFNNYEFTDGSICGKIKQ